MMWWAQNGGVSTLDSYGHEDHTIDKDHLKFIGELPFYIEKDGVLISHSAICGTLEEAIKDPGEPDSLLWYRGIPAKIDGKFHVFGHTPVGAPVFEKHYANIDTGCFFKDSLELGRLTALQYPSMKLFTQENVD